MTDRESFLTKNWDFRITVEAYETIAALSSLERETTAHGSVRAINNYRLNPRLQQKREMIKVNKFVKTFFFSKLSLYSIISL